MAKPDPMRFIPKIGADLGGPMLDESEDGRRFAEVHAGLRCGGCGCRIERGFEFVRAEAWRDPRTGTRVPQRHRSFACTGIDDCDFALRAAQGATAVRRIDNEWLFMDDEKLAGMFNRPSEN